MSPFLRGDNNALKSNTTEVKMDKKLIEVLSEVLPQVNRFSELFIRREALIPGYAAINGKDLKDVLDSKEIAMFLQEDVDKVLFNKEIITNLGLSKAEALKLLDGYPEEVKQYCNCNLLILHTIILSITNLVPTKIEDRDIKIQEFVDRFLVVTKNNLPNFENSILLFSDYFDQSSDIINPQMSKMFFWGMMHGLISLNLLTINSIFFHNALHEYFYGPADKKDEIVNKMDQVLSYLVNIKTNQDNTSLQVNSIKKDTEQIAKKTEQVLNSRETKNESLKAIKENQEKIKELVKERNEIDAEKTGTLSVEECVIIIGLITRHYFNLKQRDCEAVGFPLEVVKMPKKSTVRRNIEFWDQYQNGNKVKGRKPPRKDYSRNMSKEKFREWYNEIQLDQYNKWKAKHCIDTLLTEKFTRKFGNK